MAIANVICTNCGASYLVHQNQGTLSLSPAEHQFGEDSAALDQELSELDGYIAEASAEIEAIRSKEQGVPLQRGCALFGIFSLGVLVMAFFMTVGIDYFGKWPFYLSIAVVLGLGLLRMRRRLATLDEIDSLRNARARLEADLSIIKGERERLQKLRDELGSDPPQLPTDK